MSLKQDISGHESLGSTFAVITHEHPAENREGKRRGGGLKWRDKTFNK